MQRVKVEKGGGGDAICASSTKYMAVRVAV